VCSAIRLNVRFVPKATELLHCREMSQWADFVEEVSEQFEMSLPGHSKTFDCNW
jgi:hypothetical protein